jgi:hypothetical protein
MSEANNIIRDASVAINTRGGGLDQSTKEKLKAINPTEWNAALDNRRENLHDLLNKIAKNPKHTDKAFAEEFLAKLDTSNKKDVKMKNTTPAAPANGEKGTTNMGPIHTTRTTVSAPVAAAPVAAPPATVNALVPSVTQANGTATEATKKTTTPSTVSEAQARITELEKQADDLSNSGASEDEIALVEARISAAKRRLASLQKWAKVAEIKTFTEAIKDTSTALKDAKEADAFIANNFAPVEIGNQTYYIANRARSARLTELLSTDSALRDTFVRKMGAVDVTMAGKTYPAISTRDAVLGQYKKNEKKDSLKNAVAFDEKQYDKVMKELKDIQANPADVAKNLSQKFIKTVQSNPEQAKSDLRMAVMGNDKRDNEALNNLLKADFANPLIDWTNPKITDKITTTVTAILNNKSPAFVMDKYGVAFDGVSLVPGAIVKGKIEWKDASEGLYETKSNTIDAFLVGFPDPENKLKAVLTGANGTWPIEFGGKILEVKNGQVLSLGRPEKAAFTMRDIVGDYRTSDGVRDAVILALAIKVWGVPHLALSLPNLSFSLPHISLAGLKLPSIGSTALSFLGGFGLGWFAASLYYGENAKIGADTKQYSKYQNAYNTITSKKEGQLSRQVGDTEYKHMTWDTEGNDKSIKIYRPLGKPEVIGGNEIIAFAIGKDGKIDTENTLIKNGNDTKPLNKINNNADIIKAIEE